jgi:hypothetical protein
MLLNNALFFSDVFGGLTMDQWDREMDREYREVWAED